MPNLTSVGVSSGVPNSGTGTVSTIDALMADGGQATLGANADAASTTASISAKLRGIATALGITALDLGTGTGGTRTLRFFKDTAQWIGGLGAATSATQRVAIASDQLGTLGQTILTGGVPVSIASNQSGLANRLFAVAFATLTRPANQTPYTAADSISDNATAGSVTALVSGNISDVNDDPIFLSEILVTSTDTGLAGKKLRAYVFNANPTSSSGVVAGDNVTYSNKKAGYIGSFQGYMETGFSDGAVGRLVPTFNETNYSAAGAFIPVLPVSGARTLYIQYQAVEAFTPSANSTTIIGTAKGWQGRAA